MYNNFIRANFEEVKYIKYSLPFDIFEKPFGKLA